MCIFWPKFLREKLACALYMMGVTITYHGYNNPVHNAHKTWVRILHEITLYMAIQQFTCVNEKHNRFSSKEKQGHKKSD